MNHHSDQPKPTGEWTRTTVKKLFTSARREIFGYDAIKDAHNAALDAATLDLRVHLENGRQIHNAACDRIIQLQQQLAAEMEKIENLHVILGKKRTEIQQLREQLAAEREKREASPGE